jgi:hypothetical protein
VAETERGSGERFVLRGVPGVLHPCCRPATADSSAGRVSGMNSAKIANAATATAASITSLAIDACQEGIGTTQEDGGSDRALVLRGRSRNANSGRVRRRPVSIRVGNSMMKAKLRIALATLAVFLAIFGILAAIHGLFFDQDRVVRYSVAAVLTGVAGFVFLLNPRTNIDDDSDTDR